MRNFCPFPEAHLLFSGGFPSHTPCLEPLIPPPPNRRKKSPLRGLGGLGPGHRPGRGGGVRAAGAAAQSLAGAAGAAAAGHGGLGQGGGGAGAGRRLGGGGGGRDVGVGWGGCWGGGQNQSGCRMCNFHAGFRSRQDKIARGERGNSRQFPAVATF